MSNGRELYRLVERAGAPLATEPPYPWLVWDISEMRDHWFKDERDARLFLNAAPQTPTSPDKEAGA